MTNPDDARTVTPSLLESDDRVLGELDARASSRPTAEAIANARDLAEFVGISPSSYHAVAESARRLDEAGFTRLDETSDWKDAGSTSGAWYVVREGAIIAWRTPEGASAATPFRIVGTHTDSPGLKVKPLASFASKGWQQIGVEIYGGALLTSWFDRELRIAGRVTTTDGREILTASPAILRVPRLAIHLDRGVNADGFKPSPQQHLQPVLGLEANGIDALELIAASAGVSRDAIAGYDLITVAGQPSALLGATSELLASGRLDNLSSVHSGLAEIIELGDEGASDAIAMFAAFDHEEIGSATRTGAAGPFLEDVLVRLTDWFGGTDTERRQAIASSMCVSADAGHAVHPNYPELHDPRVQPIAGEGVLLKINANQRYTTNARGIALWQRLADEAGAKCQPFVSNNTTPTGSTIGPITATRLGIPTLDVGVPLLSMHSSRELVAVDDLMSLRRTLGAFYRAAKIEG